MNHRSEKFARSSSAQRALTHMALSGFGQSLALERTEPEVIRAARFALRLRNPAHRDVLRQLKDRLDGFRFQQRPFSRQTRALHADLSRYLAA